MLYIPIIVLAASLVVVLFIRAIRLKPNEHIYSKLFCKEETDRFATAEKLSAAVKCRTNSYSDYSKFDFEEFKKFRLVLEEKFPNVHNCLDLEIINGGSLLYKWEGTDRSLKPGIFMAHIDVVPVEKSTEKNWEYPPFSGKIADGFVWGRGTMDIKVQVITMLEACETLLSSGFEPKRTIYFAFGHDEETDGSKGALYIVNKFKKENKTFEFVIDEGGCVSEGIFASVKKPMAFIGLAEKGYLNLKIEIKGKGGHASTPPKNSSLGKVAKVICRIEKDKMKLRMTEPTSQMILAIARHMSLKNKLVLANLWLFKSVFMKIFSTPGTTREALVRTTVAPTMAKGSMEPNVLPQMSSFTVNCRILQGETINDVLDYIKKKCKGFEYEIHVLRHEEPSESSSVDSVFFKKVAGAVLGLYEDAAIIPYLMVAGTDSVKYQDLSENIIRFTPYAISNMDMKRIHSTNERISIENIDNCVKFYISLLKNN